MATFPDPPDKWSEEVSYEGEPPFRRLRTLDGNFWSGENIESDMIQKVVGERSVKSTSEPGSSINLITLRFYPPIDVTVFDSIRFWHGLGLNSTGLSYILLVDEGLEYISKDFGTAPGSWEQKIFSDFAGWSTPPGHPFPDLTRIRQVEIATAIEETMTPNSMWIDELHFYTAVSLWPILKVLSYKPNYEPVAVRDGVKIIQAGMEELITVPWSRRVSPGTYTLVAMAEPFDHWITPDGTKTASRDITVDVQVDTTVEVHWIGVAPPDSIIAGLAVVAIGGILLACFYLR